MKEEMQNNKRWQKGMEKVTGKDFSIPHNEANFLTREEVREAVQKLKRTDDIQMHDDHVYDEALDDLLKELDKD